VILHHVDSSVVKTIKRNQEILDTDKRMVAGNRPRIMSTTSPEQSTPSKSLTERYMNIGKRFWINLVYGTCMSVSTLGFYYFSAGYLAKKWWPNHDDADAYNNATQYNFLSISLGTITVPLCGMIADKWLIYNDLGIISSLALTLSYLLFMSMPPLLPMIIYTIATSTNYTAQWACLARCVSHKNMGIATGLIYSFSNLVGALTPIITTFIETTWSHFEVFILLIAFGLISLCAATQFSIEDNAFRAQAKNKRKDQKDEAGNDEDDQDRNSPTAKKSK